jgi:hypothetical protein
LQKNNLIEIAILALRKNILSSGLTGIVIAGFGHGEIFPTLVSFEVDGMVCGHLKYIRLIGRYRQGGAQGARAPIRSKRDG